MSSQLDSSQHSWLVFEDLDNLILRYKIHHPLSQRCFFKLYKNGQSYLTATFAVSSTHGHFDVL